MLLNKKCYDDTNKISYIASKQNTFSEASPPHLKFKGDMELFPLKNSLDGFFLCAIILPLFSPKYRVCCAVLDHCREELSFSATRQVSVTVPPADTVSSEVTGCKGSSSGSKKKR